MNILIVDDSKSMRQMIGATLSKTNTVIEADDGMQGLDESRKRKFDAIITDINMPNMNGYEMIAEIRKNSSNRDTPIICLTTESSDESKQRGKMVGATGWIVKPFSPEKLLNAISRIT